MSSRHLLSKMRRKGPMANVIMSAGAESLPTKKSTNLVSFSNKILTQQVDTDVEIVSASGSRHPCHKIFLTGNSPVFQAMLKGDSFVEGQTKTVTLEKMSKEGVEALLNYLYCIDSEDVDEGEVEYNCDICFELLEASEKYSMTNLQDAMKSLFLTKPDEWFGIDTAVQLFCFSRIVENLKELMQKCSQVMRERHDELRDSEDYKKLFKENPEAAMDFCDLVVTPVAVGATTCRYCGRYNNEYF